MTKPEMRSICASSDAEIKPLKMVFWVLLWIQNHFTPDPPAEGLMFHGAFLAHEPEELPSAQAILMEHHRGQNRQEPGRE